MHSNVHIIIKAISLVHPREQIYFGYLGEADKLQCIR